METPLPGTNLVKDRVAPAVTLVDAASGQPASTGAFRQRFALVACFVHADCDRCRAFVSALAKHEDDIAWAGAKVRVVAPAAEEAAFDVLVDPEGEAARAFLAADPPAIVILDRYGAAWDSYPAPDHAFPEAADVVETLAYLAVLCECER